MCIWEWSGTYEDFVKEIVIQIEVSEGKESLVSVNVPYTVKRWV